MAIKPLAPLRAWEARRAMRAERARVDAELAESRLPSPRHAWRIEELVADDNRLRLARQLTDVVHASDESRLPNARPINRGAVRESRAELLDIAARLFDTKRPVAARGVVRLERMLNGGTVYGNGRSAQLRVEAARIREALEPLV
jgi:hypothetical protein